MDTQISRARKKAAQQQQEEQEEDSSEEEDPSKEGTGRQSLRIGKRKMAEGNQFEQQITNLGENEALVVMDFSERYKFVEKREVSYNYNYSLCTTAQSLTPPPSFFHCRLSVNSILIKIASF